MEKITKAEYIAAQRVIRKYHEQLLAGQFQFLYYEGDGMEYYEKWITAKNLNYACKKMKEFCLNKQVLIDYEVLHNDKYYDLNDNEILKDFIH